MNQILSVQNKGKEKNKKSNNTPIELGSIIKFFAICLLIFGFFTIGTGSYSMYKEAKDAKTITKPMIEVQEISEEAIILKIKHDKALSKLTYSWNENEPIDVICNGRKSFEQQIDVPTGVNTLNVYVKDINNQEISYSQQYINEGDISINFEVEGNNIKIMAEGKEKLAYLTYRWDEEDETEVEINDYTKEHIVEIPKGLHKLTVIAVDINNNTQTEEQEVKGVTRPKLEVTTDGTNFIIKAADEEGIKKVEFIINETDKKRLNLNEVLPLEQRKEFEYAYPLHEGENKLEIRVYNESDISEIVKVKYNKD